MIRSNEAHVLLSVATPADNDAMKALQRDLA